ASVPADHAAVAHRPPGSVGVAHAVLDVERMVASRWQRLVRGQHAWEIVGVDARLPFAHVRLAADVVAEHRLAAALLHPPRVEVDLVHHLTGGPDHGLEPLL